MTHAASPPRPSCRGWWRPGSGRAPAASRVTIPGIGNAQRHAQAAPFGLEVGDDVRGRPVAVGAVLVPAAPCLCRQRDCAKASVQSIESPSNASGSSAMCSAWFSLYFLSRAELHVAPERIGHLDAAVAALPDERARTCPACRRTAPAPDRTIRRVAGSSGGPSRPARRRRRRRNRRTRRTALPGGSG